MNKKKSKSIKLRGELNMEVTKEVGIFDDFLIIDKKNNKKQNELKELKKKSLKRRNRFILRK